MATNRMKKPNWPHQGVAAAGSGGHRRPTCPTSGLPVSTNLSSFAASAATDETCVKLRLSRRITASAMRDFGIRPTQACADPAWRGVSVGGDFAEVAGLPLAAGGSARRRTFHLLTICSTSSSPSPHHRRFRLSWRKQKSNDAEYKRDEIERTFAARLEPPLPPEPPRRDQKNLFPDQRHQPCKRGLCEAPAHAGVAPADRQLGRTAHAAGEPVPSSVQA